MGEVGILAYIICIFPFEIGVIPLCSSVLTILFIILVIIPEAELARELFRCIRRSAI